MAVGSRYVKGGNVENWPWIRVGLSKGASVYTRIITLMPVKDPTAGFVCYRREVLGINQFRRDKFHWLCIPDRNEICRLETWDLKLKKCL